ncbi:MAG: penicillin-binding protein 1C [Myxococcales bacterium]
MTRAGIAAGALAALSLALLYAVPLPARLAVAGSTVVQYRDGSTAHVFLSPDQRWRIPVRGAEIDPAYLAALLRLEDKRFWRHPGVDPLAVLRALWLDLSRGRAVSGASTLTLQLARVLEPRPRTVRSKLIEAFRALQLELRIGKRGVLDAYLTHVPFGRNVEGVEAASFAYFGHGARALTASEIVTLLAVPQDPNRRYPTPANLARLRAARDRIAARLVADGALPLGSQDARLSPGQLLAQIGEAPVPQTLQPFPREAVHAANYLRERNPGVARLRTTLDRGAQRTAERILQAAAPALALQGIHNGAAVVVDHGSFEVRALVGNFDFGDARHGGQIAGFAVARSTGSTLKPFLYAAAIDRGLALPEELVADVPTRFGGYAPRNYDQSFAGLVRLEEALSLSLNVPFVRLLSRFGVPDFIGLLGRLGARGGDPDRYGLSAVVGGAELTPLELASAYAALAEDGRVRPLRLLASDPAPPAVAVLNPGATFLTRRALYRKDRPDFPARRELSGALASVHWKTGTSFGHRDAWATGSGPRHTAVVWLGNFDETPSPDLVGAQAAGPIFFDVLEALDGKLPPRPETPPPDLTEVDLCAVSGDLPTAACPEHRRALALRRHVPTRACPYHVAVDVDRGTGLALSPSCRAGHAYDRRTFLAWPATVRRWLTDEQRGFPEPPALASGCEVGGPRRPPSIVSPPPRQVALLIPGVPPARQSIALEAESNAASAQLSWFVDGELLGSYPSDQRVYWTPRPGEHDIVVTDEAGLSAHRKLSVRPP